MVISKFQTDLQQQAKIVEFTYLVTTLIGFVNNFLIFRQKK